MPYQPLPLPPFAVALWASAFAVFLVCAVLLLAWRGPAGVTRWALTLTPFVIPLGVTAFVVALVSGIGMVLLASGKELAVPLALTLALAVLGVASYLSMRPTRA